MEKEMLVPAASAFLTGGGGNNFEKHVQAVFVLALIIDGFAPVLDLPVHRLDFQAKNLGWGTDDLLVTAPETAGGAKLLCQMKHTLSATKSDSEFQSVIAEAWKDINNPLFNKKTDHIALITGFIAKDHVRALREIHAEATGNAEAQLFVDRINLGNYHSNETRSVFEAVKYGITNSNNSQQPTNEQLFEFWKCFTFSMFDLDYKDSVNRVLIKSLIKCKTEHDATLVWNSLSEECGYWNQNGSSVCRENIPADILSLFGYNTISDTQTNLITTITPSEIWSILALIGGWDENNEADCADIALISDRTYEEFQRACHEKRLEHPGILELTNGKWRINNRRQLLSVISDFYFDGVIKKAFATATRFTMEKSKQFDGDGHYSPLIPSEGRFTNSDRFRKGLVEGLCILANFDTLSNCSDYLLQNESYGLISNVFNNADWIRLSSLADILLVIAEMNPAAYLNHLEKIVLSKPTEIEKLFPKRKDHPIGNSNQVSNILFSLEMLAWDEKYLVQSIRCLGELEKIQYEQTNWVNTPINTIVSILLPFMPQTFATIDKQKSAFQSLKIDCMDVCWKVLLKLLPSGSSGVVTGTSKPKYLKISTSVNQEISKQEQWSLFRYYTRQALQIAGTDSEKLIALTKRTSYMSKQEIMDLLENISSFCGAWSDEEICNVWIELGDLLYQVQHKNEESSVDEDLHTQLKQTITDVTPESPLYRHKRLYLSHTYQLSLGEKSWEKLEKEKQAAAEEIYCRFGFSGAIEFGSSVDALYDIGHRIGKVLSAEKIGEAIPLFLNESSPAFYSNVIRSFLDTNGAESIKAIDLSTYSPSDIARILCLAPFTRSTLELLPDYLGNETALYWNSVDIPIFYMRYADYDISLVARNLIRYNRASVAVALLAYSVKERKHSEDLVIMALTRAAQEKEVNAQKYAVQELIIYLQNVEIPNIDALSNLEYIYLPWLDEYSQASPRALKYRLANEPLYFCEIIELTYKRRNDPAKPEDLPEGMAERLFEITYNFDVIPGTDWNGNFHSEVFEEWISKVRAWALENDRLEVSLQIIGNGLSFAEFDENNTLVPSIMIALNIRENSELRKGYRLGVLKQRGVHWLDPEGKEERELAGKFESRANSIEKLGYSRFAETLRSISAYYINEAEYNSKHDLYDE